MYIGLFRNADARPAAEDVPPVPYPGPQTIDQALANMEAYAPPEHQDPDVRRALKRRGRRARG